MSNSPGRRLNDRIKLLSEMSNVLISMSTIRSIPTQCQLIGKTVVQLRIEPSAGLYTRRGSLIAVHGCLDDISSTLSPLNPVNRILRGVPFLYQKITSSSSATCLIGAPKSSTLALLRLEGQEDWTISQRKALVAWSGTSMFIKTQANKSLPFEYRGNSIIIGRGEAVVAGEGEVFELSVADHEEQIIHASHILAYQSPFKPQQYRLKSRSFLVSIPPFSMPINLKSIEFFRVMAQTATWKGIVQLWSVVKRWSRRTIWGDRMFLQFRGPAKLLLQSRNTLPEILTVQQEDWVDHREVSRAGEIKPLPRASPATNLKVAQLINDKFTISDVDDHDEFI